MDQIVVKTEVQSNGEILLYYVDENGESQQGVVTTLDNIDGMGYQIETEEPDNQNYILSNLEDYVDSPLSAEIQEPEPAGIEWSDEDTNRLLIFYNDNKKSFVSKATQRKHLWAVACKTMLIGKDQDSCELKLAEIKDKYGEVRAYTEKGIIVKWQLLELCHQAFHDDPQFKDLTDESKPQKPEEKEPKIIKQIVQINTRSPDETVERMLNKYLKYKEKFLQEHWRKDLWDTIASELGGTEDGEYWQKRFLNYKQHYVGMLIKKSENGPESITWPYMHLFDLIFKDDVQFHKKYFNMAPEPDNKVTQPSEAVLNQLEFEWNKTHVTVLGKYYLDSYEEFEDPTIPDMFLWTEVGRLLDKKPENCKEKYETLRNKHMAQYLNGTYTLPTRVAIDIIFDNIIARDVKKVLNELNTETEVWKTAQIDELAQFFYDNLEVFKDPICYFVCWEAISRKLKRDIGNCKCQWDELLSLYTSILDDKKNDPDMQIDWRYIEIFDRIFDYGMDVNFTKGYSAVMETNSGKIAVKKVSIKPDIQPLPAPTEIITETPAPRTDPRSTKILDFYLKNKDKFELLRNKLSMWEPLAKEIDINTTQCAHRFRHLKQTYLEMVQKEIDQPKANITWPYYGLCKKVFGHRTIKSKLKQGALASDDWLARELKELISFFSKNFDTINKDVSDISVWAPLATKIEKTPLSCKEKFVELRKCYRKLKTMRSKNPDVKISWTHFNMFDRIYSEKETLPMDVEMEEEHLEMEGLEGEPDEDYQCIIVLQEGQDLSDIASGQVIVQETGTKETVEPPTTYKLWTKRMKKNLLIHYINYMRSHRATKINQKHLWETISEKIGSKTQSQCKKMFAKMKTCYIKLDDDAKTSSPLHTLMEKVLKLKKGFIIPKDSKNDKVYTNVEMHPVKVLTALSYYLSHIDDFVDPKFEKKYLWNELSNHVSEPLNTVYNKINYLKQAYNVETGEIDGQKTDFSGILNEIIVKEVSMNVLLDGQTKSFYDDDATWSETQTEHLLQWYLSNLEKFKNPKFNRSYLWMEASSIMDKSPVVCSKRMSEIRTQYKNMVKNKVEELNNWRYLELCQKIYGTGKKVSEMESN